MNRTSIESLLTRRRLLQGTVTLAASSLLPGCSSSNAPSTGTGGSTGLQSQTITFFPITSPVASGSPSIILSAAASSGLPVTFTVTSGPGSITNTAVLNILGPGSIMVAASQGGNTTYAAATTVSQTVTVTNSNPQPIPVGTIAPVTINVGASAIGTVPSGFAGLSWEKSEMTDPTYLFSSSNTSLVGLFKTLAPNGSILRLGGNSTDQFVWTPNGVGKTNKQIAPIDVQQLATFLKATGWKALYAVDLGGSAPTPLPGSAYPTTPALDAAEVAYVSNALGSSLEGFEIGNEPDLFNNGTTSPYYGANPAWSLSQYESVWSSFRSAILATTPTANITGPADGDTTSTWTVPFCNGYGKQIGMLTQHYYRTNPAANPTAASLLTPDTNLTAVVLPALKTAAAAAGIPFGMTECNSVSDAGVAGVCNSYASSFWIIDFLFNCAQGGAVQCNFHGGSNQNYYSPIQDNLGVVLTTAPSPDYYGIMLFNMAGTGTLYQTAIVTGGVNVTAYTIKTATGISMIILNKDVNTSPNVQVTINMPQTITTVQVTEMTQSTGGAAPSILATSGVTIQGSGVSSTGAFTPSSNYFVQPSGTQVTCYVPALSAILLQMT